MQGGEALHLSMNLLPCQIMVLRCRCIIFFLITIGLKPLLAGEGSLGGVISDLESREPVVGANVYLENTSFGAVTDLKGHYSIKNIPTGSYRLIVQCLSYQSLVQPITIESKLLRLSLYLAFQSLEGDEVTVTADQQRIEMRIEPSVIDLKPREVKMLAGGFEDVFRSVATLPGVVSTSDFSSQIVVRGGNPDQNLVLMDGVELYNPYRLFGVTSAFNPQTVSHFELSQGGFPAKYGDRLSGVLVVENRNGNADRWFAGNLNASVTDANFVIEGALPEQLNGSWLMSTRRTYYDLVANKFIDGATALPFFLDFQSKVTVNPFDHHTFSIFGLASREGVDIQNPDVRDGDSISAFNSTYNQVLSGTWLFTPDDRWSFGTVVSYYRNPSESDFGGSGQFQNNTTIDTVRVFNVKLDQAISSFSIRHDASFQLSNTHRLEFGGLWQELQSDIQWKVKRTLARTTGNDRRGGSSLPEFFSSPNKSFTRTGVYLQDTWSVSPNLVLQGGLRWDYSAFNEKQTLSPRLNASYRLDEKTKVKAAWGLYYQSPGYDKLVNQNFFVDYSKKINLRPEQAQHWILGVERFLTRQTLLKTEVYFKPYRDLITGREQFLDDGTRTVPILFQNALGQRISPPDSQAVIDKLNLRSVSTTPSNDGKGFAYGVEVFLQNDRLRRNDRFSGWISYAYAVAKRTSYGVQSNFDYDQRHSLSLVAGYLVKPWFEISSKFKIATGFPTTSPVGSVPYQFTIDTKDANGYGDGKPDSIFILYDPKGRPVETINLGGPANVNQSRLPIYHRLDVRASFYANFWKAHWTFYLDVINVYNQKNVFRYEYEFARSKARDPLTGRTETLYDQQGRPIIKRKPTYEFPFLPTIGLSMAF